MKFNYNPELDPKLVQAKLHETTEQLETLCLTLDTLLVDALGERAKWEAQKTWEDWEQESEGLQMNSGDAVLMLLISAWNCREDINSTLHWINDGLIREVKDGEYES